MQVKLLDLQAQYPQVRQEVRAVIDQLCEAQDFILGPTVERFEKHLAAYCGTRHAVGVSSGTDALLCSMMALGIKAGDEVICPTFTFFATGGCVARLGATPVFVDIDPHTYNIDAALIAGKITNRTKAILPVHLFGQLADMEAINKVAAAHKLAVIEDAAQAIGAKRDGVRACAWGLCGCLSFYPSKNLGAFGDGGAICTNDDDLAQRCRLLRVHGTERQYHHKMIGGMFRLAALQAGVLDVKLKYLDGWHDGRRRNAALYGELFAGSPVTTPWIDPKNWSIYNQYVVRVPNREKVRARLNERGIGSAVYYPLPLHLQECFASLGGKPGDCPHAERACNEVLALPVYPELTEAQIRHVASEVLAAVR